MEAALTHLTFLFTPITEWAPLQIALFALSTYVFLALLDATAQCLLSPGSTACCSLPQRARKRTFARVDHLYVSLNKLYTLYFNAVLIKACHDAPHVSWSPSDVGLLNFPVATAGPFLVDDLCYYLWHRLLHWGPLYRHVHKHHHLEVSPWRFTDDPYNAHPVEFVVTANFFLLVGHMRRALDAQP